MKTCPILCPINPEHGPMHPVRVRWWERVFHGITSKHECLTCKQEVDTLLAQRPCRPKPGWSAERRKYALAVWECRGGNTLR